jgi:hypothetical protein
MITQDSKVAATTPYTPDPQQEPDPGHQPEEPTIHPEIPVQPIHETEPPRCAV